jgi:hypothetical protein
VLCEPITEAAAKLRLLLSHRMLVCLVMAFLVTLGQSRVAAAAGCSPVQASKDIPYRASGNDEGIVPSAFVFPSGGTAVVHGVDASKYQEDTNFDGVRGCGGVFAYIRISAGATADNEIAYRGLWANAKSAGLLTGPYHYLTLVDTNAPISRLSSGEVESLLARNAEHARAQASLFGMRLIELLGYDPISLQTLGTYGAPYLPAVLALTARPQAKHSANDQAQFGRIYGAAVCEWIKEFQSNPHFHGQPVVLFTKPSIYRDFQLDAAPCDLTQLQVWISYYGRSGDSAQTEPEASYRAAIDQLCRGGLKQNRCIFEQYTSFGGFAIYRSGGGLDLDRYYGSVDSLKTLLQRAIKASD